MKVLVCGSRGWSDSDAIRMRVKMLPPLTIVIHGGARGADREAAAWATRLGLHTAEVRPLWDHFGKKKAGHIRNRAMLDLSPDRVIAFWDGESPGTKGTIDEAKRRGIPVEVIQS